MKRPFLMIAISLVIGVLMGEYLKDKSILFIFAIFLVLIYGIITKKTNYKKILMCTIIIFLAAMYTNYLNNKYETMYKQYNETEISVTGVIVSEVKETDYYYNIQLQVKQKSKINNTKLNVYIKKKLIKNKTDLKYGNKIKVTGEYKEPEVARNYKGFDYKKNLRTKKIYGSITIQNSFEVIS